MQMCTKKSKKREIDLSFEKKKLFMKFKLR